MNKSLEEIMIGELKELGDRKAKRMILGSMQGPHAIINNQEKIILSSTNYLGLASHPRLIERAQQTLSVWGAGNASGPRICGVTELHKQLERRLAKLLDADDALLYSSAFNANNGLVPCIMKEKDVIFSDELNHASIIDACRLSKAKTIVYPHSDTKELEHMLNNSNDYRLKMIITDGVFSMNGDLAPLPDLLDLARELDLHSY